MSAPKPRDPRSLALDPEDIDKRLSEILGTSPADLREEVEQLNLAHEVLREALQER